MQRPFLALSTALTASFSDTAPPGLAPVTVRIALRRTTPPLDTAIHLCPLAAAARGDRWAFADPSAASRVSASVLKSGIQKAVRRCRARDAVSLAWVMLRTPEGFLALARRLPIILAEDGCILPADFSFATWFCVAAQISDPAAAAATGVYSQRVVQRILQVVQRAADNPRREAVDVFGVAPGAVPTLAQIEALGDRRHEALLKALLVRAAYGSMAGDVTMLINLAGIWHRRFLAPAEPGDWYFEMPKLSAPLVRLADFEHFSFHRGMVLPEAIDFHCSSIVELCLEDVECRSILDDLAVAPAARESYLKSLMWTFRSGVNKKRRLGAASDDAGSNDDEGGSPDDAAAFRELGPVFDRLAVAILDGGQQQPKRRKLAPRPIERFFTKANKG